MVTSCTDVTSQPSSTSSPNGSLLFGVRVAIDGVDGVGKTTLADELVAPLQLLGRDVIRASIDGFHQ
jgi:hypothetical protein